VLCHDTDLYRLAQITNITVDDASLRT